MLNPQDRWLQLRTPMIMRVQLSRLGMDSDSSSD